MRIGPPGVGGGGGGCCCCFLGGVGGGCFVGGVGVTVVSSSGVLVTVTFGVGVGVGVDVTTRLSFLLRKRSFTHHGDVPPTSKVATMATMISGMCRCPSFFEPLFVPPSAARLAKTTLKIHPRERRVPPSALGFPHDALLSLCAAGSPHLSAATFGPDHTMLSPFRCSSFSRRPSARSASATMRAVLTAASGLSEMESMPWPTSQRAKSG